VSATDSRPASVAVDHSLTSATCASIAEASHLLRRVDGFPDRVSPIRIVGRAPPFAAASAGLTLIAAKHIEVCRTDKVAILSCDPVNTAAEVRTTTNETC
jgi:hypothetical protein